MKMKLAFLFVFNSMFASNSQASLGLEMPAGIGQTALSEGYDSSMSWTYQLMDYRPGKTNKGQDCNLGFFRLLHPDRSVFTYQLGYYEPGSYASFRDGGAMLMTGTDAQLLANVYQGKDMNVVTAMGAFQTFTEGREHYVRIAMAPAEDQAAHAEKYRITEGEFRLYFNQAGQAVRVETRAKVYSDVYFTWPWSRYNNKRMNLPTKNVKSTCRF